MEYQQCTRCILDTTDPDIRFDEKGVCNYCHFYDEVASKWWFKGEEGKAKMEAIVNEMKAYGKGKDYDCIIGLSGGVDSSYLAWVCRTYGLRMLAVHVDAGWNSELAVKNIENICKKLNIDLITHVVDWEMMKEVQRAFFKARVVNQDIPQDHVFFAALYHYANKNKIKYVINGYNVATESTLPQAWKGYNALDSKHIRAVFQRNSDKKLKNFPLMNFWTYTIYYPFIKKMKIIAPLNYMDYHKADAIKLLETELGWKNYGGKHHESRFTKFHQNYYLPVKFGYDKRKAHLSSLILSGQITRDEALAEMQKPSYTEAELNDDIEYVMKKLNFSRQEFDRLMSMPPGQHEDYPAANQNLYKFLLKAYQKFFKRNNG